MKMEDIRDCLTNKDKTLALVEILIEQYFENLKNDNVSNDVKSVLRYWLNVSMENNVQRIYEYAESEIEKIFLNSINVSAFLSSPSLIVFTPRFDSTTEIITSFRKRDNQIIELQQQFEKYGGKKGDKNFTDWIEQITEMPEDVKMTIKTHIIMYRDWLNNAYHLSVQATFKDIKVDGKYIRPDIFIWMPSKPNFKLIIECDGFKYHSNKVIFSKDRARDRILQSKGFQVLRFSGSEIFNDPIDKSIEVCKYLINKK